MRRRGRRSTAREARALFPLLSSIQYYHTRSDSKHAIAATGTYIYLEHRPQPVVAPSLVAPEVVVQPPLLLRGISVVQVDVVVVVAMAVVVAVVPEHGVVEATRRQQRQPREAHRQR